MRRALARRHVEAVGGGIGGFIGPVVLRRGRRRLRGRARRASQTSARDVAGTALNQVRDRTLQAASAVRSQRSTVVQTARQGESVRAQTEVVANYNHCHAMTIEYFEVLRHFQVQPGAGARAGVPVRPVRAHAVHADKALALARRAGLRGLRRPRPAPGLRRARAGARRTGPTPTCPLAPLRRRGDHRPRRRALDARSPCPGRPDTDDGDVRPPPLGPVRRLLLGRAASRSGTATSASRFPAAATGSGTRRIAPGIAQRIVDSLTWSSARRRRRRPRRRARRRPW